MDMPKSYFNRFNEKQNYEAHLFRAGYAVQSAEFNELQSAFASRLKGVADALFKDGDIVRDARIIVNADTGAVTCESGAIYVKGAVRGVEPSKLNVPTTGAHAVGVYLRQQVITELEDPSLRDPALNTRNYQEAGAARLKFSLSWGVSGDGQEGEFFPIYSIEDGNISAKEPPPQLDAMTQALARYDRDSSGGHYVVSGLMLAQADDLSDGRQVYTLSEGRARVNGFGVELFTSRRLIFDAQPDTRKIESEPHQSTGTEKQRIEFDRTPCDKIVQVKMTTQKTVSITHGGYMGAQDPLPDSSVISVLSVTQAERTFENGADFKLTAGKIDWTLSGEEPQPGSAYTVTYQYMASGEPQDVDESGFSIEGAVSGSLVLVDYEYKLQRVDALAMDQDGFFTWIKGIAADWNPQPPNIPQNLMRLATVYQTWGKDRQVVNDGVRVVAMSELSMVQNKLDQLAELIAQQRLTGDIQLREAGMKKGMFVDPFLNDSMRDAGTSQTAAIVNGELTLPIRAKAQSLPDDIQDPTALNANLKPILEQLLRTGEMKVNPYAAFDPIPADVKITPAIDRWTEVHTTWESPNTQRFVSGSGNRSRTTQTTENVLLSSSKKAAETLRPIDVRFVIKGFGAGEALSLIKFDGVEVEAKGENA